MKDLPGWLPAEARPSDPGEARALAEYLAATTEKCFGEQRAEGWRAGWEAASVGFAPQLDELRRRRRAMGREPGEPNPTADLDACVCCDEPGLHPAPWPRMRRDRLCDRCHPRVVAALPQLKAEGPWSCRGCGEHHGQAWDLPDYCWTCAHAEREGEP